MLHLLCPDSESTGNQVTLTVEFDNWENAMEAARDMQSKRPSSIPSFQAKTMCASTIHCYSLVAIRGTEEAVARVI
jgi:hypothetical protein